MRQFKAIIFDMDGLLLDTEKIALSAFLETCEQFALGTRTDLFMRCLGTNESTGAQVLKEGLEGHVDHLQFAQVWDSKYIKSTSHGPIPLKEGAATLLEYISWLSIPAAVATSTRTTRARQKLALAGILSRFDEVVGGDHVQNSKPYPDIYLKVAELLRVSPEACLALEDSENGVRAALSAGMTVVQIPDLVQPSADFRRLGHVVLRSLTEVTTYPFARGEKANFSSSGRAKSARRST